jgi:hypothetical protein
MDLPQTAPPGGLHHPGKISSQDGALIAVTDRVWVLEHGTSPRDIRPNESNFTKIKYLNIN